MKWILLSVLLISLAGLIIPNTFAENVPGWVKNTAGWWATDAISETEFINALEFLVKENIIQVNVTQASETSHDVPDWIKNTAGWWAADAISETEFVNAIAYLIKVGIITLEENLIHTDANFRVAFIGDQGHNPQAIAVLNLIKDEGAQMVLHQGDFDYDEITVYDGGDPDAWDKMISDVLGDDFPYFASIGYHDELKWNDYQEKLYDRLKKNPDVECIGDLGVKSSCTYKGLFFILVSPDLRDSGHSSFIENQLNNNEHIWRVCSWSKSMNHMQIGNKENNVGWEVYENCKNGAAIIATAHFHSYSRTKTLIDIENQIVDPEWSEPSKLRVKEGSTFVFVSGLGGKSIKEQVRCLPTSYPYGCNGEWASIYTANQNADFGAMFCTFNTGGQPNKADCYFKNIQGKIIDKFSVTNFVGIDDISSNLTEIDLDNKDMSGMDLTETVLIGADLSDTNLIGADLSGKYLADTILTGADLSNSNLTGADLSRKDLTKMILEGADLSNSNLTGADLSRKDLTKMILKGADLTDVNITGTIVRGADLSYTNLSGVDLSGRDLTGTILFGANLSDTNLTGVDLSGMDLTFTNLSGQDLSSKDLTETILTGANLTDTILPVNIVTEKDNKEIIVDSVLSQKNFVRTEFNGVDLSGKIAVFSDFTRASFKNADMENVKLSGSKLIQVDFTKIKNKSLAGADLSFASVTYSNLSGVDISDVNIHITNFQKTDLSGQDFSVISDSFIQGTIFMEANLVDSNFQGLKMASEDVYTKTFKNKAHLKNISAVEVLETLFDGTAIANKFPIYAEVHGNDLTISYILFNNFLDANLENANFKNARLWYANFYLANLTNADLSGADLTNSFFGNATLSGANLEGANLEGAILDNAILTGANLKCINHSICNN